MEYPRLAEFQSKFDSELLAKEEREAQVTAERKAKSQRERDFAVVGRERG